MSTTTGYWVDSMPSGNNNKNIKKNNQAVVVNIDSMCVHKFQATNIVAIPTVEQGIHDYLVGGYSPSQIFWISFPGMIADKHIFESF